MKLYEAYTKLGHLLMRHNYVTHTMKPIGFAETHVKFHQIDGKKVKPVTKSTYRYYIR